MPDERHDITDEALEQVSDFEEKMLKRVNRDFANAIDFMKDLRKEWAERYKLYFRGQEYQDLRTKEIYPTDFYADQIDTFVSSMMHPLWAKDEPCKLLPGPNAEPESIEAKQSLHEYQNREDALKATHRIGIQDIALYGVGIVKTDYIEKTERVWDIEEQPVIEPQVVTDPVTGAQIVQNVDTGMVRRVSVPKDVPVYKGPHSERIDPQNFFFTVDKRRGDKNPVMIRSFVSKDFFDEQPYFFNQDKLKELGTKSEERYDDESEYTRDKRRIQKLRLEDAPSKNVHQYIEWQGLVDKKELFEYLGPRMEIDQNTGQEIDVHDPALVRPGEKIMCICGVADGETVMRLEEFPFMLDQPNIVIGIMEPIDNEVVGNSIGQKLKPAAQMLDKLAGIAFKALRVAVNRGHGIDVTKIEGDVPDVNQDAWVLKCLDNPNAVHTIIDQPSIAKDVFGMMSLVQDWGRNRTGIQEISSGRGDPDSETLGETQIAANRAGLRTSDPLEIIEDTFIIPITRMRDEINQQFLSGDEDYLIEVLGPDGARNWDRITPTQIRSHTRFMCESSGREFDRAVITQQLIQANQIAPNALSAGQAVRLDRGLHDLFTSGFGRSQEEADWWLPTVKIERETGSGDKMDELMATNQQMTEMLKQLTMQMQLALGGGVGAPGGAGQGGEVTSPGQEVPQPTDEAGAAQSLLEASRPDVGVV